MGTTVQGAGAGTMAGIGEPVVTDPFAQLAVLMIENDLADRRTEREVQRAERENARAAIEREVAEMHEKGDALRSAARLAGGLAIAGGVVQIAGAGVGAAAAGQEASARSADAAAQAAKTEASRKASEDATKWAATTKFAAGGLTGGGAALSQLPQVAMAFGKADETDHDARAAQARGQADEAKARAEAAADRQRDAAKSADFVTDALRSILQDRRDTANAVLRRT